MKVILLGPPGAGKGTLAASLKEKLSLAHIATGDMLREEMKNKTPLGLKIAKIVEGGELVPDDIVIKLIEQRIRKDKSVGKGFMLDGFPRTITQAKELDAILISLKQPIDYAVYLEASLPVVIQRLTGRRVCRKCGALYHLENKLPAQEGVCDICHGQLYQRADDNEATIKTRMEVYLDNTKPIIEFYENQKKLIKLDADKPSARVEQDLLKTLNDSTQFNKNKVTKRDRASS
ncbi:MAG: adenylate kinase [Candidatus Omnitrophota bacterium]